MGVYETWVFPVRYPNGFATLVGPNKGETAVCGYHCPRDIAVRMREVLARPWVCVCVPLALSLHYFQCNRIKLNLFSSNTVFHDISKIQQRAVIRKIFARWHLAIAITSRGHKSSHLRRTHVSTVIAVIAGKILNYTVQ